MLFYSMKDFIEFIYPQDEKWLLTAPEFTFSNKATISPLFFLSPAEETMITPHWIGYRFQPSTFVLKWESAKTKL